MGQRVDIILVEEIIQDFKHSENLNYAMKSTVDTFYDFGAEFR